MISYTDYPVTLPDVATKRTYGEGCGIAHALDLVGDRWALLVVRELVLGPKRFTDLRNGILHASANSLSQRLRDLERAGIVRRRKLGPPAGSSVYELTNWGRELEPVIMALGRWGSGSPSMPRGAPMSADALMLALRTVFDPDLAGGLSARYQLRLDDDSFRVAVEDGQLELARGSASDPEATIETDAETLTALVFGGLPLSEAVRDQRVSIDGDPGAASRLLSLFPPPEPVSAQAEAAVGA
jgi:DNA-binding HxlR family transcriptional regulator